MKKSILFISSLLALSSMTAQAQAYKDGFTNDSGSPLASYWGGTTGITVSHVAKSNVTTIIGDGTSGAYSTVSYQPYDNPQMAGTGSYTGSGAQITSFNMDADRNIYVVARALKSTSLTLQIKDENGSVANFGTGPFVQTVGTTSTVLTFNYAGAQHAYDDANGCPASAPCPVDFTAISEFDLQIEAATGGFNSTLIIDYIQVGGTKPTLPTVTIASPANGAMIAPTTSPSLTATVAASSGSTVDSVVYYAGTTQIGTGTTAPAYAHTWASPAIGAYALTAVVFDKSGIINSSATNTVTVGTATGISAANIAYSNLYPNPATNVAHIEMNLVSASDVKIMVTDAVGKQMMNISQGVTSDVSYDLNVAGFTKGVYTVTYVINGSPAKASLLVVQ